jgi:predicted hydrolase (HD superfamily)
MLQAAVSVPGRVTAFALIWGGRLSDVTVKTMTGKAREKPFAAGCDRDRIVTVAPFMDLPVFL